ncbi:MAG: glycosyltransferase [Acidobacteria bacterium]|nr:glycosyltransferase [Acidobacteriota bacterium]
MNVLRVVILMPVYRDWQSAGVLCGRLDERLGSLTGVQARILLVDDASPDGLDKWNGTNYAAIESLDVLRLRRNLGHQRAIAVGLCYIEEHMKCDAVLVMDADGEDRPEDAARLIERAEEHRECVFFAARRRRQEKALFQFGYLLFRWLHRILTGVSVRVGNFSVVPMGVVRRLVCMPELWNHFAGAVYKSKAHFELIPMDRGKRLFGSSHMDLTALVAHGIAGIATFHEIVATRILLTNTIGLVLLTAVLGTVAVLRLAKNLSIPGWAIYLSGFVLVWVIQLLGISFSLVFTLISNRTSMPFVPKRDYELFVDGFDRLVV